MLARFSAGQMDGLLLLDPCIHPSSDPDSSHLCWERKLMNSFC